MDLLAMITFCPYGINDIERLFAKVTDCTWLVSTKRSPFWNSFGWPCWCSQGSFIILTSWSINFGIEAWYFRWVGWWCCCEVGSGGGWIRICTENCPFCWWCCKHHFRIVWCWRNPNWPWRWDWTWPWRWDWSWPRRWDWSCPRRWGWSKVLFSFVSSPKVFLNFWWKLVLVKVGFGILNVWYLEHIVFENLEIVRFRWLVGGNGNLEASANRNLFSKMPASYQ